MVQTACRVTELLENCGLEVINWPLPHRARVESTSINCVRILSQYNCWVTWFRLDVKYEKLFKGLVLSRMSIQHATLFDCYLRGESLYKCSCIMTIIFLLIKESIKINKTYIANVLEFLERKATSRNLLNGLLHWKGDNNQPGKW